MGLCLMMTHYRFILSESEPIDIRVDQSDDGTVTGVDAGSEVSSDDAVIRLEYYQCQHCPLNAGDTPVCPLAKVVCPAVARFQHQDSYTPARVLVRNGARTYHKDTTVQGGLSSLLGLLMGGSGCPHMAFFRPMARFHLPFSTEEETVFRAISNMTVSAYLLRNEGQQVDEVQMVTEVYRNIQQLNQGVSQRLRTMTESDATNNAIVLLDMFAKSLGSYVDEGLESVWPLYQSFIEGHAKQLETAAIAAK